MAARALTAAGRRVACQTSRPPLLASCRNGASMNHSSASERRKIEQYKDFRAAAEAMTGMQVEGALNRKNVQVLHASMARSMPPRCCRTWAAVAFARRTRCGCPTRTRASSSQPMPMPMPTPTPTAAACMPLPPHRTLYGGLTTDGSASVLDQAVFVREEDMEDVERPAAIDIANANDSIKKY